MRHFFVRVGELLKKGGLLCVYGPMKYGGAFTTRILPWALALNPADAFRIHNLAASGAVEAASGLSGAAASNATWKPLAALLAWPVAAAGLARLAFARVQP